MKKFISLISVLALLFSMMTTVAFADKNNKVEWEKVSNTESTITYKLVMTTDKSISQYGFYCSLEDGIANGLTNVTGTKIKAGTLQPSYAKKLIVASFSDIQNPVTGRIEICEITFTFGDNAKPFAMPVVPKRTTSIKDENKKSVLDNFTNTVNTQLIEIGKSTVPVTAIKLDKETLGLDLNGTKAATLTATVAPENATDKTVTWTVEEGKDVVSIEAADDKCTVTALKVGTATVKATAGGFSATCVVTVEDSTPVPPIISVESVGDMLVGNEITLNVSNDKDAALDYKFASLNEKVATVDEKGVVKAVGIGNAKITISAAGAESAELTVTVRAAGENDEVVLPGTDKKIKVFKMQNVNFDNHNYFIYITKDGVEKKSAQTIGEILGGEWVEGSDVKGTIAIGLITDSALDAFSFEVK